MKTAVRNSFRKAKILNALQLKMGYVILKLVLFYKFYGKVHGSDENNRFKIIR